VRATRLAGGGLAGLLALALVSLGQDRVEHPAIGQSEGGGGIDYAACAGCHTDKTSAPVVHPPVEMGCDTCHQVFQEEDETEIRLTAEGNELCFTCHGDKQPQPDQLLLHAPVRTGRCIVCHDPHGSSSEHLLQRGVDSREAAENLCLGCHADIKAQIDKPVGHGAVDLGCATCHATHKSEPAGAEGVFHLTQAEPELCQTCHDPADAALQEAHLGQPIARAACTECHNPHGSEQTKLLNNFVHSPFADKQCDLCHQEPREGQVVLVEGARRELCLTCHSDMQERLHQAKFTHTALGSERGCVACHSPHAATYPHQVRRGPVNLCLGCHQDLATARVEKAYLHRPVFEASCLICHQEHTGARAGRLRAEVSDLCLECHGSQNTARFQQPGPVKLFGGAVELAAGALTGMRMLAVRAGATRGHPFPSHPLANDNPGTCVTCHNPHAANGSPKLLVTETASSTPLCVRCHK